MRTPASGQLPNRQTLYEQVWTKPVSHLATEYDVKYWDVQNWCKQLNIPMPDRGYWTRMRHGHTEQRPPLPAGAKSAGADEVIKFSAESELSFKVPDRLKDPDPITLAAKAGGKFNKRYKYILLDEFQDMSIGRYQLLRAIRVQNPGVKLYAVGDDWQSIYRFTGSDLSIITQFEKHFGVTSQTAILKTYRFNDQILQKSSAFVQKNPAQLRKQLSAQLPTPEGHTSFAFLSYKSGTERTQHLSAILYQIHSQAPAATVFLIGRYKANRPKNVKHPGLNIQFFTAHGVKGMTCDYAILLDLNSGTLGFPSEMADDPMLNYLLQDKDRYENAEERRVFYVAITRARHKNYLLYHENQPSKFVTEL